MFNPVTWDAHAFPVFFGGTKLSDENTIISVPAIQMVYFVTADTKKQDAKYNELLSEWNVNRKVLRIFLFEQRCSVGRSISGRGRKCRRRWTV